MCLALLAGKPCTGAPGSTATADDENPAAYRIAGETVVEIVPEPLGGLLRAQRDALAAWAAGDFRREREREDRRRASGGDHRVALDVVARNGDAAERWAAVTAFPLDRRAAQELYEQHDLRTGGHLPWTIVEEYDALVQALRSADADGIVRQAGVLVHFCTDAAMPFNVTADYEGAGGDGLIWPAELLPAAAAHRTPRHRLQGVGLEQLRVRLSSEVRVWPARVVACPVPLQAVFDTLRETYAAVDPLLAMDRAATTELGITDAVGFVAAAERYYERVTSQAAPLWEARLEAGSLLAARLILTAWMTAGSPPTGPIEVEPGAAPKAPPPGSVPAEAAGPPAEPGKAEEAAPAAGFVASREGRVFHRPDCPHARRIRPENCVHFATCAEALRTGRTPCKTCAPRDP